MDVITLEGTVTAILFNNPENGYTVLRFETQDGIITASGILPGVSLGERLLLSGTWSTHPKYGEQFGVETFELRAPDSVEQIYRYLASGAIKNIGPAKARSIVQRFGVSALRIIENEPGKLALIKGITAKAALEIGESYRRHAGLRRVMDFLSQFGIKPMVAMRVYRDYGDDSVAAVMENPYIIAGEPYGADFSESDAIALELGFESDCSERVSAAILFELSHNLQNGHVFIPRDKLIGATEQLIGAGHEVISDALEALSECGDTIIRQIAGVEGCYLRHMYEAECYTARRIAEMTEFSAIHDDTDELIRDIETRQGIVYADMQRRALELAAKSGVMALTGGPGTGKTTTVRGVLMLLDELGLKTALCAPTGRAAKRLGDTCGKEAATIHRLLGTSPGSDGVHVFDHDEANPLKADAVIVDECSMVDLQLMRALLAAMKPECRLVMVGDADQLPSVGPGNVFADVIRSGAVPTVVLSEIFRQAQDSGIVRCAHLINGGNMPELSDKFDDFFFLRRQSEEKLAETVAQLYGERLPRNMGIDPSQIQVLSPTRKRSAGTTRLNEMLRETVNPPNARKKEKKIGEYVFRTGDKVMQIRNNYDIMWRSHDGMQSGTGVFNGDVGVLTGIDFEKETVTVDFEDKLVDYLFNQLHELEPAFAVTVHKSQGSEYTAVILAMTGAAPPLLTRSVLYTAITRAKKLLVIVGDPEVMDKMVRNDRRQRRYSGLRARLSGD